MRTWREKFFDKYNIDKDVSPDVSDIAKISGMKKSILQRVYNRGYKAASTNPTSVRSKDGSKRPEGFSKSNRMSPEQWAYGRLYGFVGGNPKQVRDGQPDHDLWLKRK